MEITLWRMLALILVTLNIVLFLTTGVTSFVLLFIAFGALILDKLEMLTELVGYRKKKRSARRHEEHGDAQGYRRFSREWLLHNAKEIAVSFAAAVAIWLALGFLLSTSAPLDVVTSCSMVPALQRGDLIVLQGVPPQAIIAPEINVSAMPTFLPERGNCIFEINGGRMPSLCTDAALIDGKRIEANLSNDILIYDEPARGQIIHRVFAKLRSPGGYFFLTKGDNNNAIDQEAAISPVSEKRVKGRVLLRIPYIGYVKLLAFGQFAAPAGCDHVRVA